MRICEGSEEDGRKERNLGEKIEEIFREKDWDSEEKEKKFGEGKNRVEDCDVY